MKTKSELLKDARSLVPEVQPLDLSRQSPGPVIVDVREKDETDAGMLPGAKPVPRGFLELRIEEAVPDRGADVVLYCAGGTRSLLAARTLKDMGYARVRSLAGGFSAWKSAGLATTRCVATSRTGPNVVASPICRARGAAAGPCRASSCRRARVRNRSWGR